MHRSLSHNIASSHTIASLTMWASNGQVVATTSSTVASDAVAIKNHPYNYSQPLPPPSSINSSRDVHDQPKFANESRQPTDNTSSTSNDKERALPPAVQPTIKLETTFTAVKKTKDTQIGITFNNNYTITNISPASIFKDSGLKTGDTLDSINGELLYSVKQALSLLVNAVGEVTLELVWRHQKHNNKIPQSNRVPQIVSKSLQVKRRKFSALQSKHTVDDIGNDNERTPPPVAIRHFDTPSIPVDNNECTTPQAEITVQDCGKSNVNGSYKRVTELTYNEAPVFSKSGQYQGVDYVIYRRLGVGWTIGSWDWDVNSLASSKCVWYSSQDNGVLPPTNGWVVVGGISPAPKLKHLVQEEKSNTKCTHQSTPASFSNRETLQRPTKKRSLQPSTSISVSQLKKQQLATSYPHPSSTHHHNIYQQQQQNNLWYPYHQHQSPYGSHHYRLPPPPQYAYIDSRDDAHTGAQSLVHYDRYCPLQYQMLEQQQQQRQKIKEQDESKKQLLHPADTFGKTITVSASISSELDCASYANSRDDAHASAQSLVHYDRYCPPQDRKRWKEQDEAKKLQRQHKQVKRRQHKQVKRREQDEATSNTNIKRQLVVLDECLKTDKQEVKTFYSPGAKINTNAAKASDHLADKYRVDFKSMNEEKTGVLELLKSYYNYELHKKEEGFDEVVIQCLDYGLESRHMNWYLRLHGRYSSFPFIGKSVEDYLLGILKGMTYCVKQTTTIQRKRGAHSITGQRTIEEATIMAAHVFKQLGMNNSHEEDHMKQAEEVFVKLPQMICYDESKYKDPFDQF